MNCVPPIIWKKNRRKVSLNPWCVGWQQVWHINESWNDVDVDDDQMWNKSVSHSQQWYKCTTTLGGPYRTNIIGILHMVINTKKCIYLHSTHLVGKRLWSRRQTVCGNDDGNAKNQSLKSWVWKSERERKAFSHFSLALTFLFEWKNQSAGHFGANIKPPCKRQVDAHTHTHTPIGTS